MDENGDLLATTLPWLVYEICLLFCSRRASANSSHPERVWTRRRPVRCARLQRQDGRVEMGHWAADGEGYGSPHWKAIEGLVCQV